MMRKLDFILVSWKILNRRVSCLPGSTSQILPQYGFQVDLSITRIWLWVSAVLKTFPWLPFAYRTAPKRLRLVCKALRDLAPCFYFISPCASYPFCSAYAKRLPDPLMNSAIALLCLCTWFVSSEHSVHYPIIKQKSTCLSRQISDVISHNLSWSQALSKMDHSLLASSVCTG